MSDFLQQMAASSRDRLEAARRTRSEAALLQAAEAMAPAPRLTTHPQRFDLIAELKLRSPAVGQLKAGTEDVAARVTTYARAGAAAVSVLTEPTRFDGSITHLEQATQALAPLNVPVMRKDFLIDPYQVLEARLAGAGGVLVIIRMLSPSAIQEMLECARRLGLFVLLEAFDEADIEVMHQVLGLSAPSDAATRAAPSDAATRAAPVGAMSPSLSPGPIPGPSISPAPASPQPAVPRSVAQIADSESLDGHQAPPVLAGLNCRDLTTLQIVPSRLIELARLLPTHVPRVAESGVVTPEDAGRVAAVGYELALVGSALMQGGDPHTLAAAMLEAGRQRGSQ